MASTSDKVPESVQEEKQSQVAHMESVVRVMNFPIVKRTADIVKTVYTKIKDNNSVTKRTLTSAESIVKNAVSTASPLVATFQKPIEKVDNLLCSGLDYVEKSIPAITTDPVKINDMFSYISDTRPMKTLRSIPEYSKQKIINASLIFKTQQAFSEFNPYLALKAYQQNLNIYEFITGKINKLFSRFSKEVTKEDIPETSEATVSDESLKKTTQESQPEEKGQSKTEATMEKATSVKAS